MDDKSDNDENEQQEDIIEGTVEASQTSSTSLRASVIPTKPGSIPKIIFDEAVDPSLDLIGEMIRRHNSLSPTDQKFIFESIYSLFSVLALESLSIDHARTATNEACLLICVEFENVIQTFHLKTFFQQKVMAHFTSGVFDNDLLIRLSKLKDGSLNVRYAKLAAKPEYAGPIKQEELRLMNLGEKVQIISFTLTYINNII